MSENQGLMDAIAFFRKSMDKELKAGGTLETWVEKQLSPLLLDVEGKGEANA